MNALFFFLAKGIMKELAHHNPCDSAVVEPI
jgi:hypothetical protein